MIILYEVNMRKSYIIFNIALISIVLILISSISTIIYLLTEYDDSFAVSLMSFKIAVLILILTIIFIAWFIKKGIKTKLNKEYEIENVRRLEEKRKKQYIKTLINYDYANNLPPYNKKQSFIICSKFGFYFILICSTYLALYLLYDLIFLFGSFIREQNIKMIMLPVGIYFLYKDFIIPRLYVNEKGVTVKILNKKWSLKWSKIKTIGISVSPEGLNTVFSRLYFTSLEQDEPICCTDYKQRKNMISVRFHPKIVHCVIKYYNGKVLNLETQKKWLRYINKLEN